MGTREIIEKIVKERETDGGIKSVVWIAAGGSNGGNYPAQYFMDREAKGIRSQMFTSNEFVYAPPKFVGRDTIAVVTSMRGTPETCVAAKVAKDLSGKLICSGMAALVGFQSFVNICVVTGLFPNTGLPLPFVSYGLTSLVTMYFGMGFVLNVGLQAKKY